MIGLVVAAHLMFFGAVDFVSFNCRPVRSYRVCRPMFWDGARWCRDRTVVRRDSVLIENDVCVTFGARW